MTRDVALAVSCCLLVVLLAALVLLVRERQISARLRRRAAGLDDNIRARDEEIHHLATVRLPELIGSGTQDPGQAVALWQGRLAGSRFAHSVRTVAELFGQSLDAVQARADTSAKSALKSSMRALQGLANEQQLAISDMQERHDDPDVLRDLLVIDHTNSQFARRAQVIAVLCGSWPGRQRAASSLVDAVRGATSRIRDYRRVQVHSQVDMAVTSRAVEPVVLAVAELLDNAARHSQPNSTVQVSIQPAQNGTAIVIDDAGVGLVEQEIRRAELLLSGRRLLNIQQLGDPPQFGFTVIGLLAARYGFRVSVDTRSPYGGVRAVLFLPSVLLTHVKDEAAPGYPPPVAVSASGPRPHPPQPRTTVDAPTQERVPAPPASGAQPLPRRRRRQPLQNGARANAPAQAPEEVEPPSDGAGRSATDAAAVVGAFARGTRAGRLSSPDSPAHEGNSRS
jgi:hypothetical protein